MIPLGDPGALRAGGKARGLNLLLRAGVRVPDGFVIPDPQSPRTAEEVRAWMEGRYDMESTAFAVRSSGLDEDGTQASFAGQYETRLNVRGIGAIIASIHACVEAASSGRVREYAAHRGQGTRSGIPIIIQKMVNARCAGVVFSADPVANRHDHVLVSAVAGLGERLVGGQSSGELYTLSRRGREISCVSEYPQRLLSAAQLQELREQCLRIEGFSAFPVDCEWAFDENGVLYWLQCRPITTLSPVHVNELDCPPLHVEEHFLTRCNVGEMMPGPVTPLTWSVFGRGIDVGMQDFLARLHVQARVYEDNRFIFMFYNHLFIDMTPLYGICQKVALTTKKDVDRSICGHLVDSPEPPRTRSLPVRLRNLCAYAGYFLGANRRLRMLKRLAASYSVPLSQDLREMYRILDERLPPIFEAWSHHYATSAKSGALNTALLRIFESDGAGTLQDHLGTLSGLLTKLGGINGALALRELEAVKKAVIASPLLHDAFLRQSSPRCLSLLRTSDSGEAGLLFRRFLRNHGHRCVREAELRESNWASDPESLVRMLQRDVARPRAASAPPSSFPSGSADITDMLALYSRKTRSIVRGVLPSVRSSVVARENSKSLCIRMQFQVKKGYAHLGKLLADAGLLDDTDQVYFLTHQELGELVERRDPSAKEKAGARRELYPALFDMRFEDFSWGRPEPVESPPPPPTHDNVLRGIPVSAGVVTGTAHVINCLSDAEELAPGEIMIASYTDVGWTPYFSTISGLVTEIGSTLSHGAVVAREYGIPAIVSVREAKSHIRTGDTLTIDGRRGIIEVHQGVPSPRS